MLIGLVGFKQVGKSTAAKYLESKYDFTRHNFKDALVQEIKDNFPNLLEELGFIYNMSIEELFDKKPYAMRALMVNYGTDVRRKDNPCYWSHQWSSEVDYAGNVVADDVRFMNEARAIKFYDGILIRLVRPDLLTGGDHASETEQLEIRADHTIECEPGDHEALYRALDDIIK